jgi:lipoprotein-releasing system permease protein
MPKKLNTGFFIARRISSPEGGRKNVMVRIATLTVAVGMAVMIIALAVINGFKKDITDKLVGFGAHVRIVSMDGGSGSFEMPPVKLDTALMDAVAGIPGFRSVVPYAVKGGIIKTADAIQGVALKGVGGEYDMSFFEENLMEGSLPEVGGPDRRKDLLISRKVADMLQLAVGDRVEILFTGSSRPIGRDRFKVCGIYSSGLDAMDRVMTFTDIRNVQRLNGWTEDQVTGYEVMTSGIDRLTEFGDNVYVAVFDLAMASSVKVEDVVSMNPNIFDWLRAHNVNAAVIIIIMLLVALLNMISAMLIILLEKTSMIGILKSLGMRNGAVRRIFLIRSLRIVLTGMLYGNITGLGVCLIQKFTGLLKLDSMGYLVSVVPIDLGWEWWLLLNTGVPVVMTLLLMIPAMVVSGIKPEKTIRFQ